MKNLLIIANYIDLPNEYGNSRFIYLSRILDKDYNVTIVTSDFSHTQKKHRLMDFLKLNNNNKIVLIKEPGYKKNVTLKRFYSHFVFGRNLKKYLNQTDKADIIYCAIPSISPAFVAMKYSKLNNKKFIIDIQDLWPEAFQLLIKNSILSKILFYPLTLLVNKIYKNADGVITVSETYKKRAVSVNNRDVNALSVYLGTDLDYFDTIPPKQIKKNSNDELFLIYIGTLGHNYDIKNVFNALSLIENTEAFNYKFFIIGEGPLLDELIQYSKKLNINVEFTGRLSYEEMVGYLKIADIAINPIKKGAAGSIINKVGDYAAAGLPVINTQENIEYRELLEKYSAGLNCVNEDPIDIKNKILWLKNNKETKIKMGRNNRLLAEDKFNRKKTYKEIYKLIKGLSD